MSWHERVAAVRKSGFKSLSGLGSGRLSPLLALDFTKPTEQPFPQTAAALYATGCGSGPCSMIHDFEETSGDALDHVGSHDLTPVNSPLQAQNAVGVGPVPWTKKAVEFPATNVYMDSGDTSFLDADGVNSFAVLLGWRGTIYSSISYLISNRDQAPPNTGWDLDWMGGSLTFRVDEGVAQKTSAIVKNIDDGAWHWILVVADANANTIQLHADNASGGTAAYTNAASNATFRLGPYGVSTMVPGQCCYMAAWEGAAAEGMGLADLTAFIKHAGDPSRLLTTKVHASMIWDLVADGKVGGWHSGQIPIGYNAGLTNVNKMGLRCQVATSTLLSESDDFDTWTKSNVTVDKALADLSDSPRGFRESQKLTATADNGYFQHLFTTVAATAYSIYAFLQRYSSMGTNVSGRIVAYDNIGAAEIDSQVFTAGTDWSAKPINLMFTTPVGCTQVGFRIEIDVSGEIICAALATAVAGKISVPIYTTGGTASVAATNYRVWDYANPGKYYHTKMGELQVVVISDAQAYNTTTDITKIFDQHDAYADRHWLRTLATEEFQWRIYDKDDILTVLLGASMGATLDDEHSITSWWSANTPLISGKHAQLIVDNVEEGSHSTPWQTTSVEGIDTLEIGGAAGAGGVRGLLAKYTVYDRPRTVL